MLKKVKDSLSAKVFLGIAGLLILCSLLIYGAVMIFLPKSYTIVASDRVDGEIQRLIQTLSQTDYDDAGPVIEAFCRNNRAMVRLDAGTASETFGSFHEENVRNDDLLTTALNVHFADQSSESLLSIIAPVSGGHELTMAFIKLLPLLLALILLIAAAGALMCSRVLVRPILEVSRISRRMSQLDMTWECKIKRTDELGTLADSLNTLARRLDDALKELDAAMAELKAANQKLREDMEHITRLSGQRRDFFAAASHELKTPITILKGQIESMILGIGSYKDTKKVLPDTLKEVENMERLVKEILTISKIEMDGMTGKMEPVDFSEVVRKVMEALGPLAREKGIDMHLDIVKPTSDPMMASESTNPPATSGSAGAANFPAASGSVGAANPPATSGSAGAANPPPFRFAAAANPLMVWGNVSLLEKAVHNIVSNGIRHSPAGAKVMVRLTDAALTVTNTNTQIPKEDLRVLFTPFYRVEKSRNKATGGSGLGLYLVKAIMELHGFSYGIGNSPEGVVFSVEPGISKSQTPALLNQN